MPNRKQRYAVFDVDEDGYSLGSDGASYHSDYGYNDEYDFVAREKTKFSLAEAFSTTVPVKEETDRSAFVPEAQVKAKPAAKVAYVANTCLCEKPLAPIKLARYLEQPVSDCLSNLPDDALIRVAHYLPLRSVASLSCVNKSLDLALSSDILYCCRGEDAGDSDNENMESIHPSLHPLRLLLAGYNRPKGTARTFAFEANIFSSTKGTAQQTYRLVDVYKHDTDVKDLAIFNNHLIVAMGNVSTKVIARNAMTSETVSSAPDKLGHCFLCSNVVETACGKKLCATLVANKYYLTVTELATQQEHKVRWQKQVQGYCLEVASLNLEFSKGGDMLLLSTTGKCCLYDALSGSELLTVTDQHFKKPILYGNYIIGIADDKLLKMYDIRNNVCSFTKLPSSALHPTKIVIANSQVWLLALNGYYRASFKCADDVYGMCSSLNSWTRTTSKSQRSGAQAIITVSNDMVYVACGTLISVYGQETKLLAKYETNFGDSQPISMITVDRTKIVYSNGDTVKIIPVDSSAPSTLLDVAPINVFAPYMITLRRVTAIALKGNLLVVSYNYESKNEHGARTIDLSRPDDDLQSYEDTKHQFNEWYAHHGTRYRRMLYQPNTRETTAEDTTSPLEEQEDQHERIVERVKAKKKVNRERRATARTASKQMAKERKAKS